MGPGSNTDLVSRLLPDSRIPERKSNQTTLACKVSQDRRCAHGCWACGEVWGSSFRIVVAVQTVVPVAVGKSQESVTASAMSGHRGYAFSRRILTKSISVHYHTKKHTSFNGHFSVPRNTPHYRKRTATPSTIASTVTLCYLTILHVECHPPLGQISVPTRRLHHHGFHKQQTTHAETPRLYETCMHFASVLKPQLAKVQTYTTGNWQRRAFAQVVSCSIGEYGALARMRRYLSCGDGQLCRMKHVHVLRFLSERSR